MTSEGTRRPVTVLAAGGTIAMQADSAHGARPAHDAAALVAAAGGIGEVDARSVRSLPGAQLSLDDALAVAREASAVAAAGRGAVVTTGTDTLEELAVLCDEVHAGDAPVVLTGAIRPAGAPGADGPANLLDAAAVAAQAPGGTYVVFAGEVHAAAAVRKVDSTSPCAFASPRTGPLGFVAEGRVELTSPPPRRPGLTIDRLDGLHVPIVPTFLGDDGALLRTVLASDPDGVVLVCLGAGHVAPAVLALLEVARCPVAATVRPERGALLYETYGFHGSERDLRAAGVEDAGALSPQAARMRLLAALAHARRG